MAFGHNTLIAALIMNVLLGVLFVYLAIEGFRLSSPDPMASTTYRKPWVENCMSVIAVVLNLALLAIAGVLAYWHFS